METVPARLKHWAESHPDKEVFVFFDERGRSTVLTPLDVHQMAGRFAARLRDAGLQKGQVVCNAMKNCPERLVTDMGTMMAGCVVANLQALERDGSDLWKTLQCNRSPCIILPAHESNQVYSLLKSSLPPTPISPQAVIDVELPTAPDVKHIFLFGRESTGFLDSLLKEPSKDGHFIHPEILPNDLAYLFTTSGTSGMSKMVPRTHEDILKIARMFEKAPPTKRYCQNQFGWMGGFPFTFLGNCSGTLKQDCFNGKGKIGVGQIWDLIENEKCSTAFSFPPELESFIGYFKDNGPQAYRMKAIITGGQPLSKRLISDILEYLSEGVAISYASTELWAITNQFLTSVDDMKDFMAGVPWAGVQVRVVNDQMEDVEAGEHGDILVKSPFGVHHYYNQPTPNSPCTEDGYYITGDKGWMSKDSVLYVTDRSDNVIINGIISVFPSWPESVLVKIHGVAEAVIIGIPRADGILSDVCACVILDQGSELTESSLVSTYNQRFMTNVTDAFFPKLDLMEFFVSFPKTETGKVKRKHLRQIVLERLGKPYQTVMA